MASNTTISIGFKVETGEGGLQKLVVDSQALKKAMEANIVESKALERSLLDVTAVNFAAFSQCVANVSSAIGSIKGIVGDLTSAYTAQVEVEGQLEQVMRNTMGARADEIQSIKDFCSAQQQIGIIGDEVQLAGAQELATYLEKKQSLEGLIPVMNDMLAQQYGYAASQENAAQIATMLGKVMEGQVGALSRYGYKFDEAQAQILKYGEESERVAVLAEVVGGSVGGMNEKLAETPTGKMQQLTNAMGDVKEQLGGLALAAEPFVSMAAGAGEALGGVTTLIGGVSTATKWIGNLGIVGKTTGKLMRVLGIESKFAATCIKGLLISTGVGIAVWALAEAIIYLTSSSEDARAELDKLADAEDNARRASEMAQQVTDAEAEARRNAMATLEVNIAKLRDFQGSKEEEQKIVKELNSTYGETMGYFSSVASWYDALIANSKAYCDQMVREAKVRKLAEQIADLEIERDKLARNDDGSKKRYSTKQQEGTVYLTREEARQAEAEGRKVYTQHIGGKVYYSTMQGIKGTSDAEKAQSAYDQRTARIKNLRSQMEAEQGEIPMPVKGAAAAPAAPVKDPPKETTPVRTTVPTKEGAPEGSIQEVKDRIADIDKKVLFAIDPDEIFRLEREKADLQRQLKALELPIRVAGSKEELEERIKDFAPEGIPIDCKLNIDTEGLKGLPTTVKAATGLSKEMQGVQSSAKAASDAFAGLGSAMEVPELNAAGIIAGAIAQMIAGYGAATLQAEEMGPWAWIAFALTGLATLTTMVTQVSAFADGGVVSGPTLALVGEYAGASSNPEVIAPLSKLKDIIGSTGGGGTANVVVTGRIKGSDIVLAAANQTTVAARSGRRSNIKV